MNNIQNISIEGARIIFRNLAGKPDKFNTQGGKRSFGVIIPDEMVNGLIQEGWNIKFLNPTEEGAAPTPWLQVKANYGDYSPNIFMVSGGKKTLLDGNTVGLIDNCEIANVDIIIRPYCYDFAGKQGVAAYVKTMYVTIVEDDFAKKYRDEDDAPAFTSNDPSSFINTTGAWN